ncbi:MAG TPA: hypothetical protein DHV28_17330 [Ignavibacteriales bacterium]|nr:hypothetical protein [Ignavibacteriales bacterium]
MKTFLLITFLFMSEWVVNGQDFIISFKGTGSSTTVEKVIVENLTQGKSITLLGFQTLHLVSVASEQQTWQYNTGDRLRFQGTSGKFSTIVMDVPTQSKTISFHFIECTDRDGNNYPVVQIGDQIWMAKNLAYLPKVSPPSEGSYTEPYYYVYGYSGEDVNEAKAIVNYHTYGVLYNWSAALNACPNGWHLPTDDEWKQLEMAIGMSQNEVDEVGWRGINEGLKLRTTNGWGGKGNGSDDFGFSGLPSGRRRIYGAFDNFEYSSSWWCSNEKDNNLAWYRYLGYHYPFIYRYISRKEVGHSIRCIKD